MRPSHAILKLRDRSRSNSRSRPGIASAGIFHPGLSLHRYGCACYLHLRLKFHFNLQRPSLKKSFKNERKKIICTWPEHSGNPTISLFSLTSQSSTGLSCREYMFHSSEFSKSSSRFSTCLLEAESIGCGRPMDLKKVTATIVWLAQTASLLKEVWLSCIGRVFLPCSFKIWSFYGLQCRRGHASDQGTGRGGEHAYYLSIRDLGADNPSQAPRS